MQIDFEHSIQQGVIVRALQSVLTPTLHQIGFYFDRSRGVRVFTVSLGAQSDKPIFSYDVPDRRRGTSLDDWSKATTKAVVLAWATAEDARKAAVPPAPPKPYVEPPLTVAQYRAEMAKAYAYADRVIKELDCDKENSNGLSGQGDERPEPVKAEPKRSGRPKKAG